MIGLDTSFLVQLEIPEHPAHIKARAILHQQIRDAGETIALTSEVIAEFIHVVTDPRRFQKPFSMADALRIAAAWWNASEVRQVFASPASTALFLDWMRQHQLGRKRILDTHLAAVLWTAGVRRILTSNPGDFQIFGGFEILAP
jgi:predicted nucleic acid-binding protein